MRLLWGRQINRRPGSERDPSCVFRKPIVWWSLAFLGKKLFQDPCGGVVNDRERLGKRRLITVVEGDVIGRSRVGVKTP